MFGIYLFLNIILKIKLKWEILEQSKLLNSVGELEPGAETLYRDPEPLKILYKRLPGAGSRSKGDESRCFLEPELELIKEIFYNGSKELGARSQVFFRGSRSR